MTDEPVSKLPDPKYGRAVDDVAALVERLRAQPRCQCAEYAETSITDEAAEALLSAQEEAAGLRAELAEIKALSEQYMEDTGQAWCYVGIRDYAGMHERAKAAEAERDEMRRAILGGEPYPSLKHGNFMEMVRDTERARLGALDRATRAEAKLADAVAVLEPFAQAAAYYEREWPTDKQVDAMPIAAALILSHVRAASAFITSIKEAGDAV